MSKKRKNELENFFELNKKLYFNSLKRLFVEFYASNCFEGSTHNPHKFVDSLEDRLIDNILVMRRDDKTLSDNPNLSEYVCIVPLIDIHGENRAQFTPKEFKSLYRQFQDNGKKENPEKSLLVLPHSYYNCLSSPLYESEIFEAEKILEKRGYHDKDKKFEIAHFGSDIMKIVQQQYGPMSIPFIHSTGEEGDKNNVYHYLIAGNFISPMSKYRRINILYPQLNYQPFQTITSKQNIDLKDKRGLNKFNVERIRTLDYRDEDLRLSTSPTKTIERRRNKLKQEAYELIKDYNEPKQRTLF